MTFMTPWLKWQEAALDEGFAHMRRMMNLPLVWQKSRRVRKGVTPSEVVYEEDRLTLLRYLGPEIRYKTPLLFVYALVNRPYILDLKVGRSVVANFVDRGFDTYLVDWGIPTQADRHLELDDYINGYLVNVIDYLCERTGSPQVNILGYCMGGTMSAMFTALHQKLVKNLILMAAAIDFPKHDGLLNLWTQPEYFDVDKFIDAYGNCPAEFLQASFQLLKPVQNLIETPLDFYENADDQKFIEDFLTTSTWINDNIPVPGEVFRQFVKYLYQQNRLTQGRMPVGKHTVNLRNITCPVLNLMASNDDLVPCSQSMPFTDLVGSTDRQNIIVPAGHVGLAIGGKAQREIWPKVCDWLAKCSEPLPRKTGKAEG